MKKTRILILLLVLCMILSACQGFRGGPTVYCIGGTWETDGNAITVKSAFFTDVYEGHDGTVYTPYSGEKLLVITLRAVFADGWSFSHDDISLELRVNANATQHKLFSDPICVNSDVNGQDYVFLFSGNFSAEKSEPEDYELALEIMRSEGVKRNQYFWLTENP